MIEIAFTAHEKVIAAAREEAERQGRTLDKLFQEWLEDLAGAQARREKVQSIIEQATQYRSSGPFTRDQMNDR